MEPSWVGGALSAQPPKFEARVSIPKHRLQLSKDAIKQEIPSANIRCLTLDLSLLDAVCAAAKQVNQYGVAWLSGCATIPSRMVPADVIITHILGLLEVETSNKASRCSSLEAAKSSMQSKHRERTE